MPDTAEKIQTLIEEGVRQQQAENFDVAERRYRAVLQIDPTQPQALALLGMLSGMFGNFQSAIDFFLKALERDPNNADIYHNLGETYRHLGDTAKAIPCFAKAIELRPELFMAYRSAADTALAAVEKVKKPEHGIELKRLALQYLRRLGALKHKKRHPDAASTLREALGINPLDVETLTALGNCLYDRGGPSEAVEMFRRAIAIDGSNATTYSQLGAALYQLRRWSEDQEAFRTALKLDPSHKIARANLITCDLMHYLYEDASTPDEIYQRHSRWGEDITAELAATAEVEAKPFPNSRDPERRLRIGFISGDFLNHPVAHFFRPLLTHHDRSVLDIYCYTEKERTGDYTPKLQQIGGTWRITDVAAPDAALREQLRADTIDIVVDMAGHTAGTRLSVLAVRAAPVTATWLGYPATTGLPTIDWRITDALADPPGYERHYTEKLLRLPDGFLCYTPSIDDTPAVAPLPALKRDAITFGSFNNEMKITPATARCWAAILEAVPFSRLVLKASNFADPYVRTTFFEQFRARGVNPARLDLRSHVAEMKDHFASYGEIDIGLDPLVYNGTTTTCEAMWMGVPVVTMIGDRHAARVGFDLLSRVGLSELAAPDIDGYIAIAVSLAQDPQRLQRLRAELRDRLLGSTLCDGPRFARSFEAGMRQIWQQWCRQPG